LVGTVSSLSFGPRTGPGGYRIHETRVTGQSNDVTCEL
jgi:hypothetical protein